MNARTVTKPISISSTSSAICCDVSFTINPRLVSQALTSHRHGRAALFLPSLQGHF